MRKLLSIALTFIMVLSLCITVCAEDLPEPIKIFVDNEPVATDTSPIVINGLTMVPARAIFEALGAIVSWDQQLKTATIVKDDRLIHIIIGNSHMAVNERVVKLDTPAILHNNRTLVPLSAVYEAFGCFVQLDDNTKTVHVYNEVFPEQKEIVAENISELIESIGSNRKIILKDGTYNISDLDDPSSYNTNISPQGVIQNVFNMTIEGNAEILIDDIYADVLSFENCKKITLNGLTAGHNTYFDEYKCEGSVTRFTRCVDIEIKNCNLYGCGAVGVFAIGTPNVLVDNTKIYDCSYTGLWLGESSATVTNSEIFDLKPFSGFVRCDNSYLSLENSSIHDVDCGEDGEFIETFDYNGTKSKIEIKSCSFKNNKYKELSHTEDADITFTDCVFEE